MTKDGVGYGALLNGVTAKQVQGMSIDDVTVRLVEMMQKNNGLKPMGNAQPINVAGAEGPFRDVAITLASGGSLGLFACMSRTFER